MYIHVMLTRVCTPPQLCQHGAPRNAPASAAGVGVGVPGQMPSGNMMNQARQAAGGNQTGPNPFTHTSLPPQDPQAIQLAILQQRMYMQQMNSLGNMGNMGNMANMVPQFAMHQQQQRQQHLMQQQMMHQAQHQRQMAPADAQVVQPPGAKPVAAAEPPKPREKKLLFTVNQEIKEVAPSGGNTRTPRSEAPAQQPSAANANKSAPPQAKRKAAEEEKRKQEEAKRRLEEMGFSSDQANVRLLEKSGYDFAKVLDKLVPLPSLRGSGGKESPNVKCDEGSPGLLHAELTREAELDGNRCTIDFRSILGTGHFADVCSGTYRFPGRTVGVGVAVKFFRGGRSLSDAMRKKIKEEVALGMKLNHPNLVRLFGVLNHDEYGPCLVLELCQDGSLRCVLDRAHGGQLKLTWNVRVKWLKEIASGMTELHSLLPNSIIHRDLKAANVLLSSAGSSAGGNESVAKVADFGVAMAMETLRSTLSAGGGTGTLAWMAPETFEGKYSNKSDVFSFALLIFEVVSLILPHADKSAAEIQKVVMQKFKVSKALEKRGVTAEEQEAEWFEENPLNARRPNLAHAQPGCPPALVGLMSKCWADDAVSRPTFRECLAFMERLEEGRPYWGKGGNDVRVILPEGQEKAGVVAAFMKTLPAQRFNVLGVERVQNAELWTSFAAKKRSMLQRAGATETWEMAWLFHGTDQDTVPKIVAQGFNRSFCGKNATKYGKGVYFAVESEYSTRDCYSKPNAAGECFIFLCRVLVGEFCQGEENGAAPAVRYGDVLYDSTVDNPRDPKIFVAYHDAQAYPEYLVKFRRN